MPDFKKMMDDAAEADALNMEVVASVGIVYITFDNMIRFFGMSTGDAAEFVNMIQDRIAKAEAQKSGVNDA